MKIVIADREDNIVVAKDFENMNAGLIAQTIVELEILKGMLLELYVGEEDE